MQWMRSKAAAMAKTMGIPSERNGRFSGADKVVEAMGCGKNIERYRGVPSGTTNNPQPRVGVEDSRSGRKTRRDEGATTYSKTLSSSFFLPQSAAAWTNASTSGCGWSGCELSCG